MGGFYFKVERSLHEGGTKYYQTILIQGPAGAGVVVTHWGAFSDGAVLSPKEHGQSKYEPFIRNGQAFYNAARRKKERRGYKEWVTVFDAKVSETDFVTLVDHWFTFEKVRFINDHIRRDVSYDDEAEAYEEPTSPKPAPERFNTSSIHKDWGTW